MKWLARLALDRPGATLLVTGLLTVVLAAGMLRLELRTDGAALHPQGDPVIEQNALDEARFRDARMGLLLVGSRFRNLHAIRYASFVCSDFTITATISG